MTVILHVDMNSFYASVEQAKNPALRGKPLAIAGNPKERKGIIVTCSYEARAHGIYTTMPLFEARKLCRELIVLPPNFTMYRAASKAMFTVLRDITPQVEPVSIDEGYMDITALAQHPLDVAKHIQQRLYEELQLPCSIGIAPNKFLAKTASDMKKPLGITVLRKRQVPEVLWPLAVREMHGVGKSTAAKLQTLGITTIGELANAPLAQVRGLLGKNGVRLHERANGIDPRTVDPMAIYDTKSVGNSKTLPRDEDDVAVLHALLQTLSTQVAERLYAKRLAGTTIVVHIRDHQWRTTTKSKTLHNATADARAITEAAIALFDAGWSGEPVRLLGVTMNHVIDEQHVVEQLSLFTYHQYEKEEPLQQVLTEIEQKFGEGSIVRGIRLPREVGDVTTSFSKDFLEDLKE